MITRNAEKLLKDKYFTPNENNYDEMCNRVANYIANNNEEKEKFYNILYSIDFLPNSPVLMNSDTNIGYLSACNVAPIEDDMAGIFDALKKSTLIQKSGGGMGFSFSRLRPQGDKVGSTGKYSSGPISFMYAFDEATNTVKQGGKRRGANMGILRVDHPNILDFIKTKGVLNERNKAILEKMNNFIKTNKVEYFKDVLLDTQLSNFNISVAITDKFMEAVKNEEEYELINPRTDEIWDTLYAPDVWDLIVEMAYKNGEPGLMFIDEVNRQHPAPEWIESFNVCGEQPLLPWESCILGAVNLSNMIDNDKINWDKIESTIRTAVRFLDNTIDLNEYPVAELEKAAKKYRKIGVGIMGWHEMLIKLNIRYGSEKSLELAEEMSKFINDTAINESQKLGKEKGMPQAIKEIGLKRRNLVVTNAAPTGSRGFIANTSSGIEPFFSFEYTHTDAEGNVSQFEYNFTDQADEGVLVTAMDISSKEHVKMQAAWQTHLGAAISKTVNLPSNATKKDVSDIYIMAYETNCKGITIYRDGSKTEQVLSTNDNEKVKNVSPQLPRGYVEDAKKEADSTRYKTQSGCGTCYTSLVNDGEKIIETFIETKNGGCKSSTEAMSRLISLALRGGISVSDVIDQLKSVSPCIAYVNADGTDDGTSCPHMIGYKLEKEMDKLDNNIPIEAMSKRLDDGLKESWDKATAKLVSKGLEGDIENKCSDCNTEMKMSPDGELYCPECEKDIRCPECGRSLRHESGCVSCVCGYSKCN